MEKFNRELLRDQAEESVNPETNDWKVSSKQNKQKKRRKKVYKV